MSTDRSSTPPTPPNAKETWLPVVFVAVAIGSMILAGLIRGPAPKPLPGNSLVGQPLPQLNVEGWLNGPGPTNEELQGQVVLIDAWAYWCGPCREHAPELVALHKTYASKGVKFLGLTTEASDKLEHSKQFLAKTGMTWPQGYGAMEPLVKLEAEYIPQVWIFDRSGRVIWDSRSREPMEAALDRALASTGG